MSAPKLADALATAHVVHDRATLEAAIDRIADDIRGAYAEGDVPLFLTVMNGGLPFAAQLAFALGEVQAWLGGRRCRHVGQTKVGKREHRPARQQRGAFAGLAQLAHVAGPAVGGEARQRIGCQLDGTFSKLRQVMLEQQRNVPGAG